MTSDKEPPAESARVLPAPPGTQVVCWDGVPNVTDVRVWIARHGWSQQPWWWAAAYIGHRAGQVRIAVIDVEQARPYLAHLTQELGIDFQLLDAIA